jgi:hypothetical protein
LSSEILGFKLCISTLENREEHDVEGDDGSCGSSCSTRVSDLVEDMENGLKEGIV